MKAQFMLFSFLVFTHIFSYAQTEKPKTKIILVGTLHFEQSKSDMYKNDAVDLKTAKRQKQVKEVVNKFAAFKPDQVCVEYVVFQQMRLDSEYNAFLKGTYKLSDNEIDQLGMTTAKQLNLKQLTAINRLGNFESDTEMNYAQNNGQMSFPQQMDVFAKGFMADMNSKMNTLSVKDFYRQNERN